jgi:putative heme-binding domain-containing protein
VKDHTPADGVTRFLINSRQWQDGATAEHWAAFPGLSTATLHATPKPIPGFVYWHNFRMHFPKDAVLMRTLSLGGVRLETQLLHYDGVDWLPYTYAWRDDQTDADLVAADGGEKEIRQGRETRVWQYHSRSQCMSCHSNQSEYALAFLPEQLNRGGPDGRNQLVALSESEYIRRAGDGGNPLPRFDAVSAAHQPKMADPADESQPLAARARAYLHANCGHCHSDHGGGSVPLRLQFSTPDAQMNAIGVHPTRGDFSLADARIIKPGDPYASSLFFRMAKFGRDRMPHIGAERPDEFGLRLIEKWIEGMGGRVNDADVPGDDGTSNALHTNAKAALVLARKLGRGELNARERDELLVSALTMPAGPVRDLFEGFLPSDQTGARKLGSNPRPQAILALAGESDRGEKLFWSEAVNCGKCHRIGERGTAVGPDLSLIGKQRTTEELLESLLAPSRRIEPKYANHSAQTTDGRSFTGLLVKRDDKMVELRDAEGKLIALAADNVQELRPSTTSLMPEGQMAGLTAQQAADLLAYLVTRK